VDNAVDGEQNYFHAAILPGGGEKLSAAGQRFVKNCNGKLRQIMA